VRRLAPAWWLGGLARRGAELWMWWRWGCALASKLAGPGGSQLPQSGAAALMNLACREDYDCRRARARINSARL